MKTKKHGPKTDAILEQMYGLHDDMERALRKIERLDRMVDLANQTPIYAEMRTSAWEAHDALERIVIAAQASAFPENDHGLFRD